MRMMVLMLVEKTTGGGVAANAGVQVSIGAGADTIPPILDGTTFIEVVSEGDDPF